MKNKTFEITLKNGRKVYKSAKSADDAYHAVTSNKTLSGLPLATPEEVVSIVEWNG